MPASKIGINIFVEDTIAYTCLEQRDVAERFYVQ